MADGYYVGIDLGGTNIKAGLLDAEAKALSKLSVPTEVERGRDAVVNNIADAAERAIRESGVARSKVLGIGIGSPGPMSHRRGLVINPGNLPCMADTPLRDLIANRTGIRTTLENDANAAAWGEFWAGSGRDVTDFVMFTLGTGVGGGVVIDGKLIRGHFENGAELGHMFAKPGGRKCSCGQLGCVEAYASAHNVARYAGELIAAGRPSSLQTKVRAGQMLMSEDVERAAKAGDALAIEVWDMACYALGVAIVTMQHVSNPQRVVLAGGMIAAGDFLLDQVRRHAQALTWKLLNDLPEIGFATLGNDAGMIGAAGCAWEAHRTGQW